MNLELKDKTVLVTGASSGIGAATAKLFGEEGAKVCVAYFQNQKGAETTAGAVERAGGHAWILQMDIGDAGSVSKGVAAVVRQGPSLDAAVLCSGRNQIAHFHELDARQWDDIIKVNLNGTFYLLRALAPYMSDSSAIVTVASVAAHTGAPHHAHYAAAKAGIVNLSKSAARALAPRVRVNCVAPGMTLTEMGVETANSLPNDYAEKNLLTRRFAEPVEIARCIVFLASPVAGFCTGATFDINGGRLLR
jgi:3-oxoacyl-[acyl-carrier protein] reductase